MIELELAGNTVRDVRLVIFDKDGTLIDLYHYWSQMVALRAGLISRKLGLAQYHQDGLVYQMGVDTAGARLRPAGPVGLRKREDVLRAAVSYLDAIGHPGAGAVCFEVFAEVDSLSAADLRRYIRPIAGAAGLIDRLAEKGSQIAMATTDKTARASLAIDFLGFSGKIALVVGADQVSQPKPDPETIKVILDSLGVGRANAVMVGDAVTDVQMGLNAGLGAVIGVLSGLASEDELRKLTPHVVPSVADIKVRDDR